MEVLRVKGKPFNCTECGKREDKYIHLKRIVEQQLCFNCDFWVSKVALPGGVRVRGHHYVIADEDSTYEFRGWGGARFVIEMDGRVIETTNLWDQGRIPERFRDRLPNNAIMTEAWGQPVTEGFQCLHHSCVDCYPDELTPL